MSKRTKVFIITGHIIVSKKSCPKHHNESCTSTGKLHISEPYLLYNNIWLKGNLGREIIYIQIQDTNTKQKVSGDGLNNSNEY